MRDEAPWAMSKQVDRHEYFLLKIVLVVATKGLIEAQACVSHIKWLSTSFLFFTGATHFSFFIRSKIKILII